MTATATNAALPLPGNDDGTAESQRPLQRSCKLRLHNLLNRYPRHRFTRPPSLRAQLRCPHRRAESQQLIRELLKTAQGHSRLKTAHALRPLPATRATVGAKLSQHTCQPIAPASSKSPKLPLRETSQRSARTRRTSPRL